MICCYIIGFPWINIVYYKFKKLTIWSNSKHKKYSLWISESFPLHRKVSLSRVFSLSNFKKNITWYKECPIHD